MNASFYIKTFFHINAAASCVPRLSIVFLVRDLVS